MFGLWELGAVTRFAASFGAVVFADQARRTLVEYAQLNDAASEAGGILLGRLIAGTNDIVVDRATAPNAADRRSRFGFRRSRQGSQVEVDRAWHTSSGTCVYLGEWHSHPEDDPTPSSRDIADQGRILAKTTCEQQDLLFVIVGRESVAIWEGSRVSRVTRLVGRALLTEF